MLLGRGVRAHAATRALLAAHRARHPASEFRVALGDQALEMLDVRRSAGRARRPFACSRPSSRITSLACASMRATPFSRSVNSESAAAARKRAAARAPRCTMKYIADRAPARRSPPSFHRQLLGRPRAILRAEQRPETEPLPIPALRAEAAVEQARELVAVELVQVKRIDIGARVGVLGAVRRGQDEQCRRARARARTPRSWPAGPRARDARSSRTTRQRPRWRRQRQRSHRALDEVQVRQRTHRRARMRRSPQDRYRRR